MTRGMATATKTLILIFLCAVAAVCTMALGTINNSSALPPKQKINLRDREETVEYVNYSLDCLETVGLPRELKRLSMESTYAKSLTSPPSNVSAHNPMNDCPVSYDIVRNGCTEYHDLKALTGSTALVREWVKKPT